MRNQDVINAETLAKYIKDLNTCERVDIVLSELYKKHWWMIKDLVYYIITTGLIKKNDVSSLVQVKALSDRIYQKEGVVEQLAHALYNI
jgi:hypothetical protein